MIYSAFSILQHVIKTSSHTLKTVAPVYEFYIKLDYIRICSTRDIEIILTLVLLVYRNIKGKFYAAI